MAIQQIVILSEVRRGSLRQTKSKNLLLETPGAPGSLEFGTWEATNDRATAFPQVTAATRPF